MVSVIRKIDFSTIYTGPTTITILLINKLNIKAHPKGGSYEISVNRQGFLKNLVDVQRAIPSKTTIPILTGD